MASINSSKPYQITLGGVGGQGVLTMTDILCDAALASDFPVRGSETHGMAQRGGSILTHVRIASISAQAFAPLIRDRSADVIISTEPVEALRHARYVKQNGIILTNKRGVPPPSMTYRRETYPDMKNLIAALHKFSSNVVVIDGTGLAEFAGNPASLNVVMLGALSKVEGFPIDSKILQESIHVRFREKFREVNQKAFDGGFNAF